MPYSVTLDWACATPAREASTAHAIQVFFIHNLLEKLCQQHDQGETLGILTIEGFNKGE